MYRIGDYVRLNPDCSTPAEQRLVFVITNVRNTLGQVVIVCINPVTITPAETVTFDMIESLF